MKKDDPKYLKAREDREKANTWLEILCHGIADRLKDAYDAETVGDLIDGPINIDLRAAVHAREAADKAYEPYRMRRRFRRIANSKRPKSPVALKVSTGRPQKTATKTKRGVAKA